MIDRAIRDLRVTGILEGISLLLLVGVAMPLKYLADRPTPVKMIGFVHGILFMIYAGAVLHTMLTARWPLGRGALVFFAGLLPGGPFIADRWLKKLELAARD